jgi:hypothetical protein
MWRPVATFLAVLALAGVVSADMDGIGTYYGGAPVRMMTGGERTATQRMCGWRLGATAQRTPHPSPA